MKRRESLHIDYQKHAEYPPPTKAVLTGRLEQRFGAEQGAALWEKTKRHYEGFVTELPCGSCFSAGKQRP